MKIMLLFTRKPGLTPEQFPGNTKTVRSGPTFDVATEITFESKTDFDRMTSAFREPAIWKQIDEDMNSFVDRSRTMTFFVDEEDTPEAKLREFA
jgi:hypothetical protein